MYEHSWSRRLIDAVAAAGGQVALHAQVPAETVEVARSVSVG